jgi:hypothetical protein
MKTDAQLREQICTSLNDDVDHYDASKLSRLNQARQRALDTGLKQRRVMRGLWLLPIAAALTLILSNPKPVNDSVLSSSDYALFDDVEAGIAEEPLDELEVLSSDDAELTDELEFYVWMTSQDTAASSRQDS